jgi:hypothetical protein
VEGGGEWAAGDQDCESAVCETGRSILLAGNEEPTRDEARAHACLSELDTCRFNSGQIFPSKSGDVTLPDLRRSDRFTTTSSLIQFFQTERTNGIHSMMHSQRSRSVSGYFVYSVQSKV